MLGTSLHGNSNEMAEVDVTINQSPQVKAFLAEIAELCREHGLSLSHQDSQGAFQVIQFSEEACEWLLDAEDETEKS